MNHSRIVFKPLQQIVESYPKYTEAVPSGIKTYIAQTEEPTTMSFKRLLAVGVVPPILAGAVGTYIVGGWPTEADTPKLRSEKKRIIAAAIITGIAIGTVTAIVAKIIPEKNI